MPGREIPINRPYSASTIAASLRRYYPVQVMRVRIKDSISADAPLACCIIFLKLFNNNFLFPLKDTFILQKSQQKKTTDRIVNRQHCLFFSLLIESWYDIVKKKRKERDYVSIYFV